VTPEGARKRSEPLDWDLFRARGRINSRIGKHGIAEGAQHPQA
jgi:hypothetical protein